MARFRLPSLSPNVKAYFSHFGRTILIIAALLVIVGLAAGTYFYGQRKHDEDKPQQTANTNNPATGQNQGATQAPSNPQNQGSGPTNQPIPPSQGGTTTPNTGPTTLSNTGPADWAGPIMAGLLLLVLLYRRSRRELSQALQVV